MKNQIHYICRNCGNESIKWQGRCNSCGEWDTFEKAEVSSKSSSVYSSIPKIIRLSDYSNTDDTEDRIFSGIPEFDIVLGGGLMKGSITLLAGDPGIGKSTLILQTAVYSSKKVLYIAGEESVNQIYHRYNRLQLNSKNLFIVNESDIDKIIEIIKQNTPEVVIIDSIQTVYSSEVSGSPGSVSQMRECSFTFMNFAKANNIPFFLIGHITKEGAIAGPKILEHLVDTVLHFEGDPNFNYRILRVLKNRFGNSNEIAVFEMTSTGLKQVQNASSFFIDSEFKHSPGSVISTILEGSKVLLLEFQALLTLSFFANPQRVSKGIDIRKLNIISAVIEKRLEIKLSSQNIFFNVSGGLTVTESASDAAIAASLISGFYNQSVPEKTIFLGEISLNGDIRRVKMIYKRLSEAVKLGYNNAVIPAGNLDEDVSSLDCNLFPVKNLEDLFKIIKK